jgi:class 3 adenylate cyclase
MRTENLAIAFVDIVGFTARTATQTREENERMLRRFADTVRPLVAAWDGRVVKSIGDAFLLTFRSPTNALLCAMGIQDRLAETDPAVAPEGRFAVRAAVNVGDVRVDGGDVFGEAVNVASRIEGEAAAGEILFSEAVYLSMTRSEVPAEEVGLVELKGVAGQVRLFRVPRAGAAGTYVIGRQAERTPAPPADDGAASLAPPPLPYGGLGLRPVRDRLEENLPARVLQPVATHAREQMERMPSRLRRLGEAAVRGWRWWREELPRSRTVQVWTAVVAVAVVSLLLWAILRRPEPATPWQRLQRDLGL